MGSAAEFFSDNKLSERVFANETKYSKSGLGWLAGPKPINCRTSET